MMRRDFTANTGAFIAAILFGASVVAVRVAVQDIPPLTLAILRFGQGGFLLLLLLLIWARDLLRIGGSDVPSLLLLGAPFFHDLSGNLQHPSPSDRGVTRCIDAGDDATMERVTWARS